MFILLSLRIPPPSLSLSLSLSLSRPVRINLSLCLQLSLACSSVQIYDRDEICGVFSPSFKDQDNKSRHSPSKLCFQNANRQSGTFFHRCVRHVTLKIVTNSVAASSENETDKRVSRVVIEDSVSVSVFICSEVTIELKSFS